MLNANVQVAVECAGFRECGYYGRQNFYEAVYSLLMSEVLKAVTTLLSSEI
jgi:hypothetical protein